MTVFSYRTGFGLYSLVLLVAIALTSVGLTIVIASLFVTCITGLAVWAVFAKRQRDENRDGKNTRLTSDQTDPRVPNPQPISNVELGTAIEAADAIEAGEARPVVRLHFLDNIKVVLTALVVLHHVTTAFTGSSWYYGLRAGPNWFQHFVGGPLLGINQSYFMVLFFFISGFLTPGSYDRKGSHDFLRDKAKRLGLPFLAFYFVLNPALSILINSAMLQRRIASWDMHAGPCWYIGWLLVFSCCYSALRGDLVAPAPRPTIYFMCAAAIILGIVNAVLIPILHGSLAFMPITLGSLPFDIAAFTVGVYAKRRGWLDEQLPRTARIAACILVPAFYALSVTATRASADRTPINASLTDGVEGPTESADSYGWVFEVLHSISIYGVLAGILCMAMCVAILELFQRCLNTQGRFARWLSRAAYTVYIVHPFVVVLCTYAWVQVQRAAFGVELVFPIDSTFSSTAVDGRLLLLGWAVVGVASQLVVWPLAACLCRLPGLRNIV